MADLKAASPAVFAAVQNPGLTPELRTTAAKYVIVEKAEKILTEN